MQSNIPKFMMGGIRFGNNFFGIGAVKAFTYSVLENGIKVVPVMFLFKMTGKSLFGMDF